MMLPAGRVALISVLKLALPVASVVSVRLPSSVWPSPLPDGSAAVLLKNSIRCWVFAAAFKVPVKRICVADTICAEPSTGKFCSSLPPLSASPPSLAVTPTAAALLRKSMPRPALSEMLLLTTVLWMPDSTVTPSPPLSAILLALLLLPPTSRSFTCAPLPPITMPLPVLCAMVLASTRSSSAPFWN